MATPVPSPDRIQASTIATAKGEGQSSTLHLTVMMHDSTRRARLRMPRFVAEDEVEVGGDADAAEYDNEEHPESRSEQPQTAQVYAAVIHAAHRTGVAIYCASSNTLQLCEGADEPEDWCGALQRHPELDILSCAASLVRCCRGSFLGVVARLKCGAPSSTGRSCA